MADFPDKAASWLQLAVSFLADALTVTAHLTPWLAAAGAGLGRFPAAASQQRLARTAAALGC